MQFSFDRTGYPVVTLPALGLDVQLLPAAKVPFERFLADTSAYGDLWYQEVLAVNPRVAPQEATPDNREGLLLTGVLPQEAMAFARWLGPGWRLPTVDQWRSIYRCFLNMACRPREVADSVHSGADRRVSDLIDAIVLSVADDTLAAITLMSGGVVEWVQDTSQWSGLGSPRAIFYPNLFNPLSGSPVVPVNAEIRMKCFGFRLVRQIQGPGERRSNCEKYRG